MRKVVAVGLMSALLTLVGCGDKGGYDPRASDRKALNPPPKPPNCPDTTELKNITLADGTLADVRIFRDGEYIFYIPFSWYRWDLDNYNSNDPYQSPDGRYNPNVNKIECPGVVHYGNFSYMTPKINRQDGRSPPNISLDSSLDQVVFFKAGKTSQYVIDSVEEDLQPFGIAQQAFIRVGDSYYARYPIYVEGPNRFSGHEWDSFRAQVMQSSDWKDEKRSVRDLFLWLRTPPRYRDNDKVFRLGAKSDYGDSLGLR